MKIKLKQAYDDHMPASDETGLHCKDPSLAQQHFLEDSDINTIVARFHLTGEVPQLQQLPSYADYGDQIFDFQSAMNAVRHATETFMQLPADLRARFHNDPQEFLQFTSDAGNMPEARKLGILSDEAIARLDREEQERNALKEKEIITKHEAKRDKEIKDKK